MSVHDINVSNEPLQPCTRAHARQKKSITNNIQKLNEKYHRALSPPLRHWQMKRDSDQWMGPRSWSSSSWIPLTSPQHHVVYDSDLSYSSSRCEGFVLNQYPAFHKHTLSIRGWVFVLMDFYGLLPVPSFSRKIESRQQRLDEVT